MAIDSVENRRTYQGDGTSAVFGFGYELHSANDVAVFAFNSSATTPGLVKEFTKDAAGPYGFTFSGTQNSKGIYPSGGSIIVNSTPNINTVMVLFRSSAVIASFGVEKFQSIPGDALTLAINRLTLISQRLQDLATRSIRLNDGFPGTFDTALPANIKQAAGKRIIVNSGATGFTFDETVHSYRTGGVVYAETNSSITALEPGPAGFVLLSQGSSLPPIWGAVSLTPVNANAIVGVLGVINGGTGTNSSFPRGQMYFSGSGAVHDSTAGMHWDEAATFTFGSTIANAVMQVIGSLRSSSLAAAPVRSSAAGTLINGSTSLTSEVSGALPVANGGTGQSSFSPTQLLIASSATAVAQVSGAAALRFLMSNGSSMPTYEIVSGSSINSAGASNGQVLTANGAGGAMWAAAGGIGVSQIRLFAGGTPTHGTAARVTRRFINTVENVGSSITYASSVTNGDTFTINDTGLYNIVYGDGIATGDASSATLGITKNCNGDITFFSNSTHNLLSFTGGSNNNGVSHQCSITTRLLAGDVIRAMCTNSSSFNITGSSGPMFSITRIS